MPTHPPSINFNPLKELSFGLVAHTQRTSTLKAEEDHCKFKASLNYKGEIKNRGGE